MKELRMELSKYVPSDFEIGDLVLYKNISKTWHEKYNYSLGIIIGIDRRYEVLTVKTLINDQNIAMNFKEFDGLRKNSNKLVKLII